MPFASKNRRTVVLGIVMVCAATISRIDSARAAGPASSNPRCPPRSAAADPSCAQDKPTGPRRGLSVAASFVPGVLVHGSGHFVAGQTRTGWTLLGAEGLGLGLALASVGGTAVTGATRRFIGPMVLGIVTGGALLMIPALADIYGVLAPKGGTGTPLLVLPSVETRLGLAYVYDPNFAYGLFLSPGVDVRVRNFRFSTSAYFALDDANTRARAAIAYRFFGPRPQSAPLATDGSYLEAEFALTNHAYTSNGFSVTTGEVNLGGRLDLWRVGETLRGSFAELGFGLAYAVHRYTNIATEANDLLTPRFAFGMYLGHSGYPRGELSAYYEHRHDGFVGGLKTTGLGSGNAGHFGVAGRLYASRNWGVAFNAAAGSSYMGQVDLLFRYGGRP